MINIVIVWKWTPVIPPLPASKQMKRNTLSQCAANAINRTIWRETPSQILLSEKSRYVQLFPEIAVSYGPFTQIQSPRRTIERDLVLLAHPSFWPTVIGVNKTFDGVHPISIWRQRRYIVFVNGDINITYFIGKYWYCVFERMYWAIT